PVNIFIFLGSLNDRLFEEDLSNNNISSINGSQLAGLKELVRLKIGHNPLQTLHRSLQEALPALRALELGDTLLRCDCHLVWLVKTPSDESGNQKIGLDIERASSSRKKRRQTQKSKTSNSFSVLEMDPGIDQVVFAGDSLKLQCRVTGFDSPPERVWWKLGPKGGNSARELLPNEEDSVPDNGVTIKTLSEKGATESFIHIPQLNWDHSGEWSCVVESNGKNNSRSLSVYVIHHDTKYCAVNVTSGNKGTYSWPRTVAAVSVELPCQGISPLHSPSTPAMWPALALNAKYDTRHARHSCDVDGKWYSLNTDLCPYVSEATRILEHFAATNLTIAGSSLSDSARTLRNFTTANKSSFRDPIDIYFLAKTIHHYSQMLTGAVHVHPVAEVLIDIIGTLLSSTKEILKTSEELYGSCSSLLSSLWQITDTVPSLTRASTPHLHLYQVGIRPQSFGGVSCIWFRKTRHSIERHFRCNANNFSLLYAK
ncbi:Adhesion G protein-coupled receptor A3, partial [Armadillidium nasatum]